ncbi:MAG: 23S rRNA (guanosine(2251)-2'-O)-methyltransferase RlmB [Tissierellia bacterium]|nr:23S rRNA (guanosine(2251)-2'-O)-methyltransferase RlmB [Tissierellia bacterium]
MALSIGRNPIMERLKAGKPVDRLYVVEGEKHGSILKLLGKAKAMGVPIFTVPAEKLDEMAEGGKHQGVVAIVTDFSYQTVDEILERAERAGKKPKLVILDGLEDPHNLGAIIRTAECAGFHGIIIPERRSVSVTDTVIRTSAGAVEYMPVARVVNISDTIDYLKDKGLWIYCADMGGESTPYDVDLTGALALVVGGEGKGVGKKVREHCDVVVSLPMFGQINSLNASNAAAILIYESVRQEQKSHG